MHCRHHLLIGWFGMLHLVGESLWEWLVGHISDQDLPQEGLTLLCVKPYAGHID